MTTTQKNVAILAKNMQDLGENARQALQAAWQAQPTSHDTFDEFL